jgi:hypothetical protein
MWATWVWQGICRSLARYVRVIADVDCGSLRVSAVGVRHTVVA